MSYKRFREVFNVEKVVLPVVHVESNYQALYNVEIAAKAGADGVFLIGHNLGDCYLLEIFEAVRKRFPNFWMGLNRLSVEASQSFVGLPDGVSGIWTDNACIKEGGNLQVNAEEVLNSKKDFPGLYFGGVAFKYQEEIKNLKKVSGIAKGYMDVVTTSGERTGYPPDIQKIQMMREGLGDFPLALASGVNLQNIEKFLPYVDCFLVSTGISSSFEYLDGLKVVMLVNATR